MSGRVALVHDWLTGMRGGERVLEVFCGLFPEAEIFTLLHLPGSVSPAIESHRIRATGVQRLPGIRRFYRHYLPLYPRVIERIDLSGYELVISLSHCVAHGVLAAPTALHLCYCFTPMRYVWDHFTTYFSNERNLLIRMAATWQAPKLRTWDQLASQRVDAYATTSRYVARRIRRYYRRDARVIPPGIDLEYYSPQGTPEDYYLVVSALSPYKRLDLAIEACNRLRRKLVIIGWGPKERALKRLAGPTITFLGKQPDHVVREHYRRCRALLFPGEEDFGLTPLEAQACGRPVIAYARGGCLETVLNRTTGLLFPEQTVESLAAAIREFERLELSPAAIRAHAERFDVRVFRRQLKNYVDEMRAAFLGSYPTEGRP